MRTFLKRVLVALTVCLNLATMLCAEENAAAAQKFTKEIGGLHYFRNNWEVKLFYITYADPKSVTADARGGKVKTVTFGYDGNESDYSKSFCDYEFDAAGKKFRSRFGVDKKFSAWQPVSRGGLTRLLQQYVFLSKSKRDVADEKARLSPSKEQKEAEKQMVTLLTALK